MDGVKPVDSSQNKINVFQAVWRWWKDVAASEGRTVASWRLIKALAEFVRNSTPERLRQRYGDADFDWEYRVNTTSGAVGWRERLLGLFHSPYQPTEAGLFREMIGALAGQPGFDFSEFTFIDLGSGKGRTLLMASDYPFRRILGVEIFPALHEIARENLGLYQSESQKCFAMESFCGDATRFSFPGEPIVLFLFNPFPEAGLRIVMTNLERSLRERPRKAYVVYHNPVLGQVLDESAVLQKIGGTHQYALYWAG